MAIDNTPNAHSISRRQATEITVAFVEVTGVPRGDGG